MQTINLSIDFFMIASYLFGVNTVTFFTFGWDKFIATRPGNDGGGPRISELTLLTLSAVGGSPAAIFSKYFWNHKTKKKPFNQRLHTVIFLQFCVLGIIAYQTVPVVFGLTFGSESISIF